MEVNFSLTEGTERSRLLSLLKMSGLSLCPALPFQSPVRCQREGSTACPGRILWCICLLGFWWVCLGQPRGQQLQASLSPRVSESGKRDRLPPPSPPRRAGSKIADDRGTWPVSLHLAPVRVAGKVIAAIFCQHEKKTKLSSFSTTLNHIKIAPSPLKKLSEASCQRIIDPKSLRRLVRALPWRTVKSGRPGFGKKKKRHQNNNSCN